MEQKMNAALGLSIVRGIIVLLLVGVQCLKCWKVVKLGGGTSNMEVLIPNLLLAAVYLILGLIGELSTVQSRMRVLATWLLLIFGTGLTVADGLKANYAKIAARSEKQSAEAAYERTLKLAFKRAKELRPLAQALIEKTANNRRTLIEKILSKLVEEKDLRAQIRSWERQRLVNTTSLEFSELETKLGESSRAISELRSSRDQSNARLKELRVALKYCDQMTAGAYIEPSTTKKLDAAESRIRTNLNYIEKTLNAEIGAIGLPKIQKRNLGPSSPMRLLEWAATHADEYVLTKFWLYVAFNLVLSVFSILLGHLSHAIAHRRATLHVASSSAKSKLHRVA